MEDGTADTNPGGFCSYNYERTKETVVTTTQVKFAPAFASSPLPSSLSQDPDDSDGHLFKSPVIPPQHSRKGKQMASKMNANGQSQSQSPSQRQNPGRKLKRNLQRSLDLEASQVPKKIPKK
jgi:hypothetical protein